MHFPYLNHNINELELIDIFLRGPSGGLGTDCKNTPPTPSDAPEAVFLFKNQQKMYLDISF